MATIDFIHQTLPYTCPQGHRDGVRVTLVTDFGTYRRCGTCGHSWFVARDIVRTADAVGPVETGPARQKPSSGGEVA